MNFISKLKTTLDPSKVISPDPGTVYQKPKNDDSLDALQSKLFDNTHVEPGKNLESKVEPVPVIEMPPTPANPQAANFWIHDDLMIKPLPQPKKPLSTLNKLLIGASGLLTVTLLVAIFIWTREVNVIDPAKVITSAIAPTQVDAAKELELIVTIENFNKTPMTNAVLVTRFSSGSFSAEGNTIERYPIGFIDSEGAKQVKIPFILNGATGDTRELNFELQYSVPDVSTTLLLDFSKTLTIERSPISLRLDVPNQQTAGESQAATININTTAALEFNQNIVELELPDGVTFATADPRLIQDEQSPRLIQFRIDELDPGSGINITGQLGINWSNPGQAKILARLKSEDLVLASVERNIQIVLPPLSITRRGSTIGVIGQSVESEYILKNTTDRIIQDVSVLLDISGQVSSVNSNDGIYNSSSRTLQFNPQTKPALASIDPGESISVTFRFTPIGGINVAVSVNGTGLILQSGTARRSIGSQNFSYELSSQLQIDAYATYRRGQFNNTGPLPPKSGQETTYTIVLGTRVADPNFVPLSITASLPAGVRVLGSVPDGVVINGNRLIWNRPLRSEVITFQIALTPTNEQIGQSVLLLNNIRLDYEDRNQEKYQIISPITTMLLNDPGFNPSEGVVGN